MKIIDILNEETPSLSFEVFPPKSEMNFLNVKGAITDIAKLKPSFMSVTYGAGGSTSKNTLNFAKSIQDEYGVPSLAHMTCIDATRESVDNKINLLKEAGIENIMALRGDIPADMSEEEKNNIYFKHATDLIKEIKSVDENFCIGAACYPEVHPESKNQNEDIRHLKEKVDAGADFLTTQMFFNNNLLYSFLYKLREAGVNVPVIAGIMPICKANQIRRAQELSDCFIPHRFKMMLDKYGDDEAAMMQAGIIYATNQIIDLYANGITHVHVYTMNNTHIAKTIKENLSDIIK